MSRKLLKEPEVKRAVKRYLDSKGYRENDSRELHETGPDLKMGYRKNGRTIVIEAKGETGAKSEQENKILHALGQIVSKYKRHDNYFHGLAFPYTWKSRVARKISHEAMVALNLRIYLVRDDGKVIEIKKKDRAQMNEM